MIWNRFIAFVIGWINLPGTYSQVLLDNVCINPQKEINAVTAILKRIFENKISEITAGQESFEKLINDKVSEISTTLRNLEEETSKLHVDEN